MSRFELALYFFLVIQIAIVAIIDFRTRRIWNIWPVVNIAIFFILSFLPDLSLYSLWWPHLQWAFLMLGSCFVLFWIRIAGVRIMGGGDGKFLSSLLFLMPTRLQLIFFEKILWVTIAVGSILLLINIFKNFRFVINSLWIKSFNMAGIFGSRFPFAPLIIMAWIWVGLDQLKM